MEEGELETEPTVHVESDNPEEEIEREEEAFDWKAQFIVVAMELADLKRTILLCDNRNKKRYFRLKKQIKRSK